MDNKRSPNYPSVGLMEAVALAKALWEREKRSLVPGDVVARAWGYKGENGLSRMKVASLKKFGLLEGRGSDGVRLTDLAIPIITYPVDAQEYLDAVQAAAMKPDLFREIYETHANASDENLRAYLITKRGFSDQGAKLFVRAFRDTMSLVNPDQPSYNRADEGIPVQPPQQTRIIAPPPPPPPESPSGSLSISMGPLSVSVRVLGEKITAKHLGLVRQYLAVAEAQLALEADASPADPNPSKPVNTQGDA